MAEKVPALESPSFRQQEMRLERWRNFVRAMSEGNARARLLIALLLSALAHLLASSGLIWPTAQVPDLSGPPIAVVLTPLPTPASLAPPASPPSDRLAADPVPSLPTSASPPPPEQTPETTETNPKHIPSTNAETAVADAETEPERPSVEPPTPTPPAPPPKRPAVPLGFTIRYVVQDGESGFTLGRLEHIWQSDGVRYSLSAVAQASGIMRLIYSGLLTQTSYGEITEEGLRPDSYWLQRGQRQLRAHFDWTRMQADLGAERPPQALQPGTQDLLSVMYQVSLFPTPAEGRVWVLDGKRLREYRYRELARETIELPIGQVPTRRFRVQAEGAEEFFELWLRETHPRLPVKIRLLGHRLGDAVLLAESIRGLANMAD